MFCTNCGCEIADDAVFCPHCGVKNADALYDQQEATQPQPASAVTEDADFKAAAKKYWYCFLFPLVFFVPILNNGRQHPGNADVANSALWVLILTFGLNILGAFVWGFLSSILSLCSIVVSGFSFVNFILSLCGKAVQIPLLGSVKIIKSEKS